MSIEDRVENNTKPKIKSFKDLKVWQESMGLAKDIYKILETFPKEEKFILCSQMKRAVISIPSNIAEGFRRRHNKEYKQFINIALGSSAELETQLILAKDLGFISSNGLNALITKLDYICRMLVNLSKKL
jgi:four helix bundle protein